MPWKKAAAIGGAMTMSVVRINPNPPCCIAMLLTPSWLAPRNPPAQNAADTASTMSRASATMTLNTARENMVPMP